ncbi:NADH:ubiquinone reductase (Na(+)-transporting) subunit C [Mesorhizobium sp. SB112]|uniref:NADH:ubiquinone reductase (Na(+)-transporting) subunit C n=1 Tax=Mesorhizobium sp. SB112 TaxID=3151853 RepID=UPI003267C9FB
MADTRPPGPWRRFLNRPNTDRVKTIGVSLLIAVGCGLTVSIATVALRPIQQENISAQQQGRMAKMLENLPGIAEILKESGASGVETLVIDLASGTVAADIDPASFDQRAEAVDLERSSALPRADDLAGLGRRENHALVYILRRGEELALVVLPVRGAGYQSTISAYLALEADLDTVAAFTVYEQGETPGLGARIAEDSWQAQWAGKHIFDDGDFAISVVRGSANGPHEVDGISGASVTGYAISDMLEFWMGERGFGPFLDRLKNGEIR